MALETFPRDEFLVRRFRYLAGEHVTIVGPTGCGKTWLAYQMLELHATPQRPAIVLVKKPRDPLIVARAKKLGYRTVRTWPPMPSIWRPRKPAGWLVWPRTRFDPMIDRPHKAEVFRRAILDSYKRGNRIVYADDTYGISEVLDLREDLIEMWTEMRSMGGGVWAAFQRPSHVPLWAYSQAEHLFLFKDPDRRARERFAEIGGVDPRKVQETVMSLRDHQALYIRRSGGRMCIVDA